MPATNNAGYEIQEYTVEGGWVTEFSGYVSSEECEEVISILPPGNPRRIYESLEGY